MPTPNTVARQLMVVEQDDDSVKPGPRFFLEVGIRVGAEFRKNPEMNQRTRERSPDEQIRRFHGVAAAVETDGVDQD